MNDFVDSVVTLVKNHFTTDPSAIPSELGYATFVSSESVDSDLSRIRMSGGQEYRGVPKGATVGTLTSGAVVLVAIPRMGSMMIIARMAGNPVLFTI